MRIFIPLALLLTLTTFLEAQMVTQPVGISKVTIAGTGGARAASYTPLSVTYEQSPVVSSTVSSASGSSLTLSSASMTAGSYAATDPNGDPTHYVMLTSGDQEGITLEITANTTDTLTLSSSNLESLSLAGASVEVVAHATLADIFGADNTYGLTSGSSVTSSDRIYLMQADGSGTWNSYFYQTNPRAGTGWRRVGDTSTDYAGLSIPLDTGLLIRRISTDDTHIYLKGSVKVTNKHKRVMSSGFSLVGNPFPKEMTLGACGIYGSDNGYVSGSSHLNSDRIFVIAEDGTFDSFYYQTNPRAGNGWRRTGDSSTDVSSEPIPATSSFYIQHRGTGLTWNPTRPYSL
jgi:uncharacterized protein (TIGR02597 family)